MTETAGNKKQISIKIPKKIINVANPTPVAATSIVPAIIK